MNKPAKINSLDTLEREIYRLKLEVKRNGEKIEEQFDFAKRNFVMLAMRSFSIPSIESLLDKFLRRKKE